MERRSLLKMLAGVPLVGGWLARSSTAEVGPIMGGFPRDETAFRVIEHHDMEVRHNVVAVLRLNAKPFQRDIKRAKRILEGNHGD